MTRLTLLGLAVAPILAAPFALQGPDRGGAPARPAPRDTSKLDPAKRRAVEALAKDWFTQRPATYFQEWDATKHAALLAKAKALDAVPAAAVADVKALLWNAARAAGAKLDGHPMETTWGKATYDVVDFPEARKPARGFSSACTAAMKGSRGVEGLGQSQFSGDLAKYKCVGVFPQALNGFKDAWDNPASERFVLSLIEMAKRTYEIDPARVYVGGYSMGATGALFYAGRHSHFFASALAFNGILLAEREGGEVKRVQHGILPNLRYVPVYLTGGTEDEHCKADTYQFAEAELKKLRGDKTDEYEAEVNIIKGAGHAMPKGEPQASYAKFFARKRRPLSKSLRWEALVAPEPTGEGRLPGNDYYWMHCNEPAEKMHVEAECLEHSVQVKVERHDPKGFAVYLTKGMVDTEEDVRLYVNNEQKWKGRLEPSLIAMLESLSTRFDRDMIFEYKLEF